LETPEPFVGIPFSYLMLTAGVLELAGALVCFFSRNQILSAGMVAWLATMISLYRLNLWWLDWHTPCSCLGTFTDLLHLSPGQADNIMKVILAYLFLGSYAILIRFWWELRAQKITSRSQ